METLLAITLFVVSTTITPGPNNIMIMTSGLNYGISRSLPHLLGICFGFPLMVLAIGLGLGTLFEQYPGIHEVIKYLGIAYMLFLAWKIATSHTDVNKTRTAKPLSFIQAALFQWVNPKAWMMSAGAIATYTSVAADAYLQALIIALTFLLLSFPCVGLWLFFGLSLKNILASETQQKYFNFGMGAVLAVSVLPMLTL
ncbi:MAG: LysE family translocator [Gammaproteobacteria bacterium]